MPLGGQATNLHPSSRRAIAAGDVLLVMQVVGADIDVDDNHAASGGEAGLGNVNPALEALIPDAAIDYRTPSVMGVHWFDIGGPRFEPFLKFGLSSIRNEASDDPRTESWTTDNRTTYATSQRKKGHSRAACCALPSPCIMQSYRKEPSRPAVIGGNSRACSPVMLSSGTNARYAFQWTRASLLRPNQNKLQ